VESPVQPFAPPGSDAEWVQPMPGPAPNTESVTASGGSSPPVPAAEQSFSAPFSSSFAAPAPTVTEAPIPNGDFESADGWQGANSELSVVSGGVSGTAVRVHRAARSDSFAIVAGKVLAGSAPGKRYRAGAYVRSLSPGMFVCLRVEEFSRRAGGVPITSERCRAATAGWQRLKVDARSTAKGSRIVFSVRVLAALGGTSFDVDSFRLG
jgi:hypothetical protein